MKVLICILVLLFTMNLAIVNSACTPACNSSTDIKNFLKY